MPYRCANRVRKSASEPHGQRHNGEIFRNLDHICIIQEIKLMYYLIYYIYVRKYTIHEAGFLFTPLFFRS